ncbi:MAG TPA: hypothetical protein VFI42_16075 [Thermomicrobiaceae bacterium]|nr:hypothetical protein [Thermomicrobiaceae bacterium]
MTTEISHQAPPLEELSAEEARRFFDGQARRYVRMSGAEFVRRWEAGEIEEPERPEVQLLAMLLPFARAR